jgi:hypothetical protein
MSGSSRAAPASGTPYLLDSGILVRSLRGDAAIIARIASEPLLYLSNIIRNCLHPPGNRQGMAQKDARQGSEQGMALFL